MSNTVSDKVVVELTKEQRDLLLRGLRFVRSSVLLATREPSPAITAERLNSIEAISELVDELNGTRPASTTASV